MKNRIVITLLTVIAVLLGANLIVSTAGTTWAQDRGSPTLDRQPERGQQPVRGIQPERGVQPERGERRPVPQREPRVVGITTAGNLVVILWDNGAIESREVPSPR